MAKEVNILQGKPLSPLRVTDEDNNQRIFQSNLYPSSVKRRYLGTDIITSKPGDEIGDADTLSFSFTTGQQALITWTLETTNADKLMATMDLTIYVGSVLAANQLPGGSTIDETTYQIIGPWYDWGATDNKNVKVKLYILNISAGTVTILTRSVWRYISNNPNATVNTS